jgi:hypothetical protein
VLLCVLSSGKRQQKPTFIILQRHRRTTTITTTTTKIGNNVLEIANDPLPWTNGTLSLLVFVTIISTGFEASQKK